MSDVRLTATNPEDSSAVPVACNAKGELLLEEIPDQSFDGNLDGDLDVTGRAEFAGGNIKFSPGGAIQSAGGLFSGFNFDDNTFGAYIQSNGSAVFGSTPNNSNVIGVGILDVSAAVAVQADGGLWRGHKYETGEETSSIDDDGSAEFKGDVIVGSRSKKWTLVESGGLCHMIEVTRRSPVSTADLVDEPDEPPKYPKLRDVFHELDLIEQALEQVMTKLRLDPPAGWPVWDGSDNLE